MSETITLACVTQNRIKNIQRNIPKMIDYVDRIVIVDGFSVDGTKEWLENYSDKITVVQREWDDSFANQYNRYLDEINDGWVLILDDDEIASIKLLKSLRKLIEESDGGKRYDMVECQAYPLEVDRNGIILSDNGPVNYYRHIFYKYNPGMKYTINLHQNLVGHKIGRPIRTNASYYHIKSEIDEYRNACRNWWIAGVWIDGTNSGYQPPEWHELRAVVVAAYPSVKVFNNFNDILIKGNLDQSVKDYLLKIKDIPDEKPNRLFNEFRAIYKYYFEMLHPEEQIRTEG